MCYQAHEEISAGPDALQGTQALSNPLSSSSQSLPVLFKCGFGSCSFFQVLISAKHQEIPETVLFTRPEGGAALVGAVGISAPAVTSLLSHEVLWEEEGKCEGWALTTARSA